ncbi:hypothetical protein RYX36_012024 [Vicia faba]
MAKFEMEKIMSIIFMLLLVVAQADDFSPTPSPSKNPILKGLCIAKNMIKIINETNLDNHTIIIQ